MSHPSIPRISIEDWKTKDLYDSDVHIVYKGETVPDSVKNKALFEVSLGEDALPEHVNSLSDLVTLESCQSNQNTLKIRSSFLASPQDIQRFV